MSAEKALVTEDPKPKVTFSLVLGVLMAVVGSSFQFGYNIAVVNAPADEIKEFFFPCEIAETSNSADAYNTTTSNTTTSNVTIVVEPFTCNSESHRTAMYSLAVAVFPGSAMIGSLLVGPVVQRFGRRGGLMVNNIVSFVSAVFLGLAKPSGSFAMIVIGRFFIGIFAGLASGVVPVYIGEISPKEWRGAIGVLNQLLITIGILFAQILGLQSLLGTDEMWPWLLAFTAVPSIIQMVAIPFMPKSPRYLLIDQQKEDQARNALVKLRGTGDVANEMDEMRAEAQSEASVGQMSILQLFAERSVRWQLITVLLMMVAQQLSGINAVFFYSNTIFDAAEIPKGNPQDLASVGVGAVNVLMTIVSVGIIERTGRKALLVWGFGMMIFWCVAMTVVLNVLIRDDAAKWISYLSVACMIGYIVGFAIGPGPIPWLITAELFRQAARPPAFMVACMANWFCNFIIGISFPSVQQAAGPYVFIIFTFVCISITAYLQIMMPETKGKTFQEINHLFAKLNGVYSKSTGAGSEMKVALKDMDGGREDDAA